MSSRRFEGIDTSGHFQNCKCTLSVQEVDEFSRATTDSYFQIENNRESQPATIPFPLPIGAHSSSANSCLCVVCFKCEPSEIPLEKPGETTPTKL